MGTRFPRSTRRTTAGMAAPHAEQFESIVLPHLDDAYTLARHLVRDEHDAQDVVQEAMLRAVRHIGSLTGLDARAWLLTIVRNCCYTWLTSRRTAHARLAEMSAAADV